MGRKKVRVGDAGSAEMQQVQELLDAIDPTSIDIRDFEKYPEIVRTEYFLMKRDQIVNAMNERVKSSYSRQMPQTVERSLQPCKPTYAAQCGDQKFEEFWTRLRGSKRNVNPVYDLFVITFKATRGTDGGCHKLIFGEDYPSRISQSAALFLHWMGKTPVHSRKAVLELLQANQSLIESPFYILQTRIFELADEYGFTHAKIMQFPHLNFYKSGRHPISDIADMFADGISPTYTIKEENRSSNQLTISWDMLVWFLCVCHMVGADRLLLQDYSDFAVNTDGTPLTAKQKEWLSAFLCAKPVMQEHVLASMIGRNIWA